MLHQPAQIPGFSGSYGLISSQRSTSCAIAFVHGFWGDAYSTWQDFQVLVDECSSSMPLFLEADLFFFQYEAAGNFVGPSADKLGHFIKLLFPRPPESLFSIDLTQTDWGKELPFTRLFIRRGPYEYKRLVLVGHSLGAVVIRQLILDLACQFAIENCVPALQIKHIVETCPALLANVCLISPAHLGFRPAGTLGALFSLSSLAGVLRTFLAFYRAFSELEPDSALLKSLRQRTEALAVRYPQLSALSAKSLWAENDDVVVMDRFDCDPPMTYASGRNHVNVCKPLRNYLKPLEFLAKYGQTHAEA
jgi:pimeloyl-ACP methyl ester carboxylesterase